MITFFKKNLLTPYGSLKSKNFTSTLFIVKWLKRISIAFLLIAMFITIPRWVIGTGYQFFNEGNFVPISRIIFEGYAAGIIPLLLMIFADIIALLISCEEKLGVLFKEDNT